MRYTITTKIFPKCRDRLAPHGHRKLLLKRQWRPGTCVLVQGLRSSVEHLQPWSLRTTGQGWGPGAPSAHTALGDGLLCAEQVGAWQPGRDPVTAPSEQRCCEREGVSCPAPQTPPPSERMNPPEPRIPPIPTVPFSSLRPAVVYTVCH